MNWKRIDYHTPKDGRSLFLAWENEAHGEMEEVAIGGFDLDVGWIHDNGVIMDDRPTHWMPIPPVPVTGQGCR